jgi:hypothetical protein
VFKKIVDFQEEARIHLERINETLKENEAEMLIMTDENRMRIQPMISSDIRVFLVRPPDLNDVQRWLRECTIECVKKEAANRK